MKLPNAGLVMPYPGLRPFKAEDQPLFFGREAQVGAMLRQLEDHRFVAVVGSSGSGKSSLVRAGLLPAIHEGFLLGSTSWLSLIFKPGSQPYQRLAHELQRATRLDEKEATASNPPSTSWARWPLAVGNATPARNASSPAVSASPLINAISMEAREGSPIRAPTRAISSVSDMARILAWLIRTWFGLSRSDAPWKAPSRRPARRASGTESRPH